MASYQEHIVTCRKPIDLHIVKYIDIQLVYENIVTLRVEIKVKCDTIKLAGSWLAMCQ